MREHGRGHHRGRTTATALVAALLLVACGDQVDDTVPDAPDTDAEEVDDEEGDGAVEDAAAEEAVEDEAEGEEFAQATWLGEEVEFRAVSCGGLPQPGLYEIRATMEDGGYQQARMELDPDADPDAGPVLASGPYDIDLFFEGDGGTIGDGEGYGTRGPDSGVDDLDYSATHVAGAVNLEPDLDSRAAEVNPEGGSLEFEILC